MDVAIVGGGVAGLTAAITAANAGASTAIFERAALGGQVVNADEILNYPGTGPTTGPRFVESLTEQAARAGVTVIGTEVLEIKVAARPFVIRAARGMFTAGAVILATGAARRRLGIPGETEMHGRGVAECASCDGPLFAGKAVAVVGGGDTAADEAVTLSRHAREVVVIHRRRHLTAAGYLRKRLESATNIRCMPSSTVERIEGASVVEAVTVRNGSSVPQRLAVDGVFVCIGTTPEAGVVPAALARSATGHVPVDERMRTRISGVFAVGDVRGASAGLIASCVGDGAIAATAALEHLASRPTH